MYKLKTYGIRCLESAAGNNLWLMEEKEVLLDFPYSHSTQSPFRKVQTP